MNERKLARSLGDIATPNSDRSKVEPKENSTPKMKPVVKSKVTVKKPTVFDKIKTAFIGDGGGSLGDFVIYDVLIPAFKNTISDLGVGIIQEIFGGGNRGRVGGVYRDRGRSYVSYNSLSTTRQQPRSGSYAGQSRHQFDNIIFRSRGEAEEVLRAMAETVLQYGAVSVRSFYELSGLEGYFTDEAYGWYNLEGAYVDRTRDGFVIALPRPIAI